MSVVQETVEDGIKALTFLFFLRFFFCAKTFLFMLAGIFARLSSKAKNARRRKPFVFRCGLAFRDSRRDAVCERVAGGARA